MGHRGTEVTEDVYINLPEEIYDCDKEIGVFIESMEFGHLETIEVKVDENYLLELLPCKAYNSTGVNIHGND